MNHNDSTNRAPDGDSDALGHESSEHRTVPTDVLLGFTVPGDERTADQRVRLERGNRRRVRKPRRFGSLLVRRLVRLLLWIYLLGVLASGYWYWIRPVRWDQLVNARSKWGEITKSLRLPTPENERWGG